MQQENKKWYVVEGPGYWNIEDINGNIVTNADDVGSEIAEENAKLCASAPQMRELLRDMFLWMEGYMNTPGQYNRNAVIQMINEYEKLEQEYGK